MNRKKSRTTDFQISSITQIHDPDAARKWMDLYVQLLKKQLIAEHSGDSQGEE
ncbi:hypothetical protein MUG84_16755 [Paenibacillus sp. KQZ6P-2]|uniref:Uncharacterized protein n=1 Tax=Paenibacillus mangrovi TaxID=2931978 RepID=A0A9X2B3F6_9BACL|nr:hypothetical protein [Paenibacillus mangrovi]MCJ8013381.1 hypothetical protein [Paenibacillus mangrovi]